MKRLWFYVILSSSLVGCSGSSPQTEAALTGVVRTEGVDSHIVAGASVKASNLTQPITTAADGSFSLPKSKIGEAIVVQITAVGYAPQTRSVASTATESDALTVSLHPVQTGLVALPAATEPPATFQVGISGSSATLHIPSQSLVDSAGNVAQGNVTVNMAYWNYLDYKNSAPLPMKAQAANPCDAPIPLTTYGMAEISITQNGNELAVAPLHTLGLTFLIPAQQQNIVAALISNGTQAPRFYSGDHNQALWIEEGNLNNGILTYDSNTQSMTGQMAHLSTWNLDNSYSYLGGCVTGQIVGADGVTPTANESVNVWLLSRDETVFYKAQTDANGNYCINTGANTATTTVNYYVASSADVAQSNMCNPMPSFCSTCTTPGGWLYADTDAFVCSHCVLRNDAICTDPLNADITNIGCNPRPSCNTQSSATDLQNNCTLNNTESALTLYGYQDSCSPQSPVVPIEMCHFCPGTVLPASCSYIEVKDGYKPVNGIAPVSGSCGNLGVTSFVPNTKTSTKTSSTTTPAHVVCAPGAATTKYQGQACSPTDDCCPVTSSLVCEDFVCVPPDDGTTK